ncbi:MAG: carbamoyltransferase HypF [Acidisphaera sp.]|nr:carbamoyltransferase HypF [Acidisphaera sp.]
MQPEAAELIRVRGLVQGVGFRPTAWRLARRHGLSGWIGNDGDGVSLCVRGASRAIDAFARDLLEEAPPLARIDDVDRQPAPQRPDGPGLRIVPSRGGAARTGVVPDAAMCAACAAEIRDPDARRYRYPFTNCTHCGPRLSIIEAIPYDRATTTMRSFPMCVACAAEYASPGDRRFHAQPIACPACGPRAWLEDGAGPIAPETLGAIDAIDAARVLLRGGHIVAVKGLGGFHLACDTGDERATARLRRAKRREAKPFAVMARDLDVVRRFCVVEPVQAAALAGPAGPIVLMAARRDAPLAPSVSPGLNSLGVMLPYSPLHALLLEDCDRPIVMTSGNLAEEPQCINNEEARARLAGIADAFLMHDRDIACRVDDSVLRVAAGAPRVLRRARGYAPAPLVLPAGFAIASPVLAMGGELKSAFCLLRNGQAVLSHHLGDLENASSYADYRRALEQYLLLFEHAPSVVAVDLHPEYLSSKFGLELAEARGLRVAPVQHHHAHIAACMAENQVPIDAGPVLGVAFDGLGYGPDGTLWGGEFLLADYRGYRRLGHLKPVAMPGAAQAIREPWRNTFAHLRAALDGGVQGAAPLRFLAAKPCAVLDAMIAHNVNAPLASSCGRLFDAVAAAVGICRDRAQYEGQPALELEAAVDPAERSSYPFAVTGTDAPLCLEPAPLWAALLDDIDAGAPVGAIAARFHRGLAAAVADMVATLRDRDPAAAAARCVALSGGVFQNKTLLEGVTAELAAMGLEVLQHREVPANDGGLALGQAVIAAATARD